MLILLGGTDVNTGESAAALGVGVRLARLVSYFTIQSNVIVLVASISLAVAPNRDGRIWRVLRLDSLLVIAVTGVVYNLLLARLVHLDGVALWTNAALHIVAPVLTLVVWAVVGPRPRITWAVVGWAFVWPVAWIVGTFVRGAITGWYPYPFMDAATLGYPRAVGATSLVIVLALVLAVVFVRLDRRPTR
ncbi:MAG TPA: Pr6Pr family membrane protein [Friedmanniella sp.]